MRFSLLVSLLASNVHAATLNVVDGQLMGASGVLVDGSEYDVQFLDGTCIDLYNGCDDLSDFTFQTLESAHLASQALLDQVFLDGPSGQFDTFSFHLTNGCLGSALSCQARTPTMHLPPDVWWVRAENWLPETLDRTSDFGPILTDVSFDTSVAGVYTYAVWTPAPIPEPSTALLLGLGLVGMAGYRRR